MEAVRPGWPEYGVALDRIPNLGIYAMSVAAVLAVLTRPIGDESDVTESLRALFVPAPGTATRSQDTTDKQDLVQAL